MMFECRIADSRLNIHRKQHHLRYLTTWHISRETHSPSKVSRPWKNHRQMRNKLKEQALLHDAQRAAQLAANQEHASKIRAETDLEAIAGAKREFYLQRKSPATATAQEKKEWEAERKVEAAQMQLQVTECELALLRQSAAHAKEVADAQERVAEFARKLAAETSAHASTLKELESVLSERSEELQVTCQEGRRRDLWLRGIL